MWLHVLWQSHDPDWSSDEKKGSINLFPVRNPSMMLKLKLQLMQRADSLEKTLMLGKIGGRRRREQQVEMVGWHH